MLRLVISKANLLAVSLILLAALFGMCLVLAGCRTPGQHAAGRHKAPSKAAAQKLQSQFAQIRGVWDGPLRGRLEPYGQPRFARLVIGAESSLILPDKSVTRLVPVRREQQTFVFRGEPASPNGKSISTLKVDPQSIDRGKLLITIAWQANGSASTAALLKAYPLDDGLGALLGLRASYFNYEDWQSLNNDRVDGRGELKSTVLDLAAHGNWKCLDGQEAVVQPGKPTVLRFSQSWGQTYVYVIFCERGGGNLAYWIVDEGGAGIVMQRMGRIMDYPTFGMKAAMMGPTEPCFTFQFREADPEKALAAESTFRPVKIAVLKFGNTFGNSGRGFDFDRFYAEAPVSHGPAVGNTEPPGEQSAPVPAEAPAAKPGSAEFYVHQGDDSFANGQYRQAAQFYTQALAVEPDNVGARNMRAMCHAKLEDFPAALADYDKVLAVIKDNGVLFFRRGNVKYALNQYDEAYGDYRQALILDPKMAEAWFNLGLVYLHSGDKDEALDSFKAAIRLDPRNKRFDQAFELVQSHEPSSFEKMMAVIGGIIVYKN